MQSFRQLISYRNLQSEEVDRTSDRLQYKLCMVLQLTRVVADILDARGLRNHSRFQLSEVTREELSSRSIKGRTSCYPNSGALNYSCLHCESGV